MSQSTFSRAVQASSAPSPFSVEESEGVLTLTLDTPGSKVNIFTLTAAEQLAAVLRDITPATTKAVVIRSGKPRSFLNGAQLMLANAVKTREDAARLTGPVRAAYAAIRALPVPSIAMVQGSCYGCGVEMTLQCTYRVAVDVGDTDFYMTEIADYLVVTAFGATRDLPPLLGLDGATDFLLWGEHWGAREAMRRGLVQACFAPEDAEAGLRDVIAHLTRDGTRPRHDAPEDLDAVARKTRARIGRLAPTDRPLYEDCFSLLEDNARGTFDDATARAREVDACGRSAMLPASKAAQGFFFLRQIAEQLCLKGVKSVAHTHVALHDLGPLAPALLAHVDTQLTVSLDADVPTIDPEASRTLVLASSSFPGACDARVCFDASAQIPRDAPVAVCVTREGEHVRFIEVASEVGGGGEIYAALTRAGFRAVTSKSDARFVTLSLLDALAGPLEAHAARGGDSLRAARALRDFGFVDLPREALAARLSSASAALTPITDDVAIDDDVMPEVLLSLLACVRDVLARGRLPHPTVADVMARDLLGFPLGHGGLCRYLTPERVEGLLRERAASHVTSPVRESAEAYVARGAAFYR